MKDSSGTFPRDSGLFAKKKVVLAGPPAGLLRGAASVLSLAGYARARRRVRRGARGDRSREDSGPRDLRRRIPAGRRRWRLPAPARDAALADRLDDARRARRPPAPRGGARPGDQRLHARAVPGRRAPRQDEPAHPDPGAARAEHDRPRDGRRRPCASARCSTSPRTACSSRSRSRSRSGAPSRSSSSSPRDPKPLKAYGTDRPAHDRPRPLPPGVRDPVHRKSPRSTRCASTAFVAVRERAGFRPTRAI